MLQRAYGKEDAMKKKIDVVRAWRDAEYRNSLTDEERAGLPEHPAGLARIDEELLKGVVGGARTTISSSCVPPGTVCP
jgi:mersacidin/lichenicidin family type 2 lantibiotic